METQYVTNSFIDLDNVIADICDKDYTFFLEKPNVIGIGLAYKIVKCITTTEKCISVFVSKKIPKELLKECDKVPNFFKGIKTDVIETGKFELATLNKRIRPVTGGYSIGNVLHPQAGTMGCLVTDGMSIYILSNNHVLSNFDTLPIGSFILQPGIIDGGNPKTDIIAILSKTIPIKFKTKFLSPTNTVDCAMAKVITPSIVSKSITYLGPLNGIIVPRLGAVVQKVGRTTERTRGAIAAIKSTVTIESDFGEYILTDQIITSLVSKAGDSGSILLDVNKNAVGLLVTSTKPGFSSYNTITNVLKGLNVRLVTS